MARRTYRQAIEEHPDRLIMLCGNNGQKCSCSRLANPSPTRLDGKPGDISLSFLMTPPQFWGVFLPAPDAQDTSVMEAANRYTVDLFQVGGGVARVFEGGDRLEIALAIYQSALVKHPDKLVVLCDQSHVLARSDQRPSVPDGITLLKRGVSLSAGRSDAL
jgi:hypothetical protein